MDQVFALPLAGIAACDLSLNMAPSAMASVVLRAGGGGALHCVSNFKFKQKVVGCFQNRHATILHQRARLAWQVSIAYCSIWGPVLGKTVHVFFLS